MSQTYAPGETITGEFPISSSTGAATNADSAPGLLLYQNGTVTGVSVSSANPATGRYTWSAVIPGYNSFFSCTTRYGNSRPNGANDVVLVASPFSSTVTLELAALNQGDKANVSRGAVQFAGGSSGGGAPMIGSRIGGALAV